jgi:hypothetical protein
MNPMQLFLFAGLPVAIGVIGVLAGETFRARSMSARQLLPKDASQEGNGDLEEILSKVRVMAKDAFERFEDGDKEVKGGFDLGLKAYEDPHQLTGQRYLVGFHNTPAYFTVRSTGGDVVVGTLRKTYGDAFASGLGANERLRDVLFKLDKKSLNLLIRDYQAGTLANILTFCRFISQRGAS